MHRSTVDHVRQLHSFLFRLAKMRGVHAPWIAADVDRLGDPEDLACHRVRPSAL
ncbi:MAG: hypothetical protein H6722_27025 [Sandaracinus sp.]|nr:hypothetical protein [Sandaracinus sp.]